MDDNQQKANVFIEKANTAWANKQYDEAARWYEQGALLYRPYSTFYLVCGECYLNLRDFSAAEEMFLRLTDYHPEHDQGWWMLGQALMSQHRYTEAEKPFDKSIALGATDVEAYYYAAIVKATLRKNDEILPLLKKALELNPKWEAYARDDPILRDYVGLI